MFHTTQFILNSWKLSENTVYRQQTLSFAFPRKLRLSFRFSLLRNRWFTERKALSNFNGTYFDDGNSYYQLKLSKFQPNHVPQQQ